MKAAPGMFLEGPRATHDLGARMGASAEAGALILVVGEVGAGKTTLAQGVAAGLGVPERVTSPTFVLVREHALPGGTAGPRGLVHVDLYRVTSVAEADDLALGEYLDDGWVVLVEWPDRIPALEALDALMIRLVVEGDARRAAITGRGDWGRRVAATLQG